MSFLLAVEAAAVDELACVIGSSRNKASICPSMPASHVADVLAPIFFGKAQAERRRAATEKKYSRWVGRP